jgi:hypothetical protein
MKKCPASIVSSEMQIKPQRGITLQSVAWLECKRLIIPVVSMDVEQLEFSVIAMIVDSITFGKDSY